MLTVLTRHTLQCMIGSLLCLILGGLSSLSMTPANLKWYHTLTTPPLTPPDALFAPIWTILYILLGIAMGHCYHLRRNKPLQYTRLNLQFLMNILWSPIFFGLHAIHLALMILLGLWGLTGQVLWRGYQDRVLKYTLTPYWIWVSIALYLNMGCVLLNSA